MNQITRKSLIILLISCFAAVLLVFPFRFAPSLYVRQLGNMVSIFLVGYWLRADELLLKVKLFLTAGTCILFTTLISLIERNLMAVINYLVVLGIVILVCIVINYEKGKSKRKDVVNTDDGSVASEVDGTQR